MRNRIIPAAIAPALRTNAIAALCASLALLPSSGFADGRDRTPLAPPAVKSAPAAPMPMAEPPPMTVPSPLAQGKPPVLDCIERKVKAVTDRADRKSWDDAMKFLSEEYHPEKIVDRCSKAYPESAAG